MSPPIFPASLTTSTTPGGSSPPSATEPSAVRGSPRLADGQTRRVILFSSSSLLDLPVEEDQALLGLRDGIVPSGGWAAGVRLCEGVFSTRGHFGSSWQTGIPTTTRSRRFGGDFCGRSKG